jgi:hypothetical protein
MKALVFRCRCGAGVQKLGMFVLNKEELCSRKCLDYACRRRATRQRSRTFDPKRYELPLKLEGG